MFSTLKTTDAEGCVLFPAFPAPDLPGNKPIFFCGGAQNGFFAPQNAGFAGLGGYFPNNVRKKNKASSLYPRVVFSPLQIRQIRHQSP